MEDKNPKDQPLRRPQTLETSAAPAGSSQPPSDEPSHKAAADAGATNPLPTSPKALPSSAVVDVSTAATDLQKKMRRAERFGVAVQLSEEEKRNSRAERFGVAVQLSEEEKRNSRAERFGTAPISHGKSEEEKRKARAERFGITGPSTADEEARKKARLARFGTDSKVSSMEEEKMKARAIRFSQPTTVVSGHSNVNGKSEIAQNYTPTDKATSKT